MKFFTLKVFYFHEKAFPPIEGRFQKKVVFVGDVLSSDASILVRDVMFSYNGTFSCQVKNPPDVHGNVGEIQLRVVASGETVIMSRRSSQKTSKQSWYSNISMFFFSSFL